MNHFTIHLKLIYYQSTIFQFKKYLQFYIERIENGKEISPYTLFKALELFGKASRKSQSGQVQHLQSNRRK